MAQTEDTELRDLVIEALEKNGSLAKIRALLRANIFLAFEDECENLKQNETLDKLLLLPEGKLCLSIIHDFLDFCNLRNTLFVYKSETRQGTEYTYEGRNNVADKLNINWNDQSGNKPVLLTLVNNILNQRQKNVYKQDNKHSHFNRLNRNKNYKGDQDCTYIVHEDSNTTTSNSQSDNSSDEKNNLDLRLTLDNSDTDTSSGSLRGASKSEYILNNHTQETGRNDKIIATETNLPVENFNKDSNVLKNSSTESTSFVDLKPFNQIDSILLNTTGLPYKENEETKLTSQQNSTSSTSKADLLSQVQTHNSVSESIKKDLSLLDSKTSLKSSPSNKNDEFTEYSYDFTSPSQSGKKDTSAAHSQSTKSIHEETVNNTSNNSSSSSNKQNSFNSQSSVSISDVADLISEKSSYKQSYNSPKQFKLTVNDKTSISPSRDQVVNSTSDNSGDFSESPIPSLSNLSPDIHSD